MRLRALLQGPENLVSRGRIGVRGPLNRAVQRLQYPLMKEYIHIYIYIHTHIYIYTHINTHIHLKSYSGSYYNLRHIFLS